MKKALLFCLLTGVLLYSLYSGFYSYTVTIEQEILDEVRLIESTMQREKSTAKSQTINHKKEIQYKLEQKAAEYDYPLLCLKEAEDFRRYSETELIDLIKSENVSISGDCL